MALGLSALCRPSTLPAAVLVAIAALVAGPGSWTQRIGRGAIVAAATIAMLAPWAVRNARVFGEPVWTTTHGGYTLALANNPIYYAEVLDGPPGAVWSGANQKRWFDAIGPTVAGLSEPAADRRLRSMRWRLLRRGPATSPAPRPRGSRGSGASRRPGAVYPGWLRIAVALWTIPLWVALVAGLARRALWRWPRIAAPAMLAGADGGPCVLLDRHADASPAGAGHRADRGREPGAVICGFLDTTDRGPETIGTERQKKN